ncbi:LrgB family protein [Roseospira marina]|uniref:LrgB family protein n=1 Tax=Roseospira marina TaxID=140057 RepID=A0A5M6IBI6_9PROT|nr:LrgB family protein [Roseospira marina]KAA5605601.1 LrgB family protein [Roseospira marina]MBB4313331.1 putative murein hydrolase (TIGR00659 family) [Roseospira marina]MBB5085928.1 putative murein hydrolase (TIGR00659 family) [Roseospira marina]
MMHGLTDIWVYLARDPLFGLTLTVLAYLAADVVYRRLKMHPLANPVLWSVVVLGLVLAGTGISYDRYFQGAQFIHVLLGPATVALAVPLYRALNMLRSGWPGVAVALLASVLVASLGAIGLGIAFGAGDTTVASLAPKSVTTPIAMGISERIGGLPSLTAVLVILTGILGAVLGPSVLNALGVRNPRARGIALGAAAHGIGTARAFNESPEAGYAASLAMGGAGVLTAVVLPILW